MFHLFYLMRCAEKSVFCIHYQLIFFACTGQLEYVCRMFCIAFTANSISFYKFIVIDHRTHLGRSYTLNALLFYGERKSSRKNVVTLIFVVKWLHTIHLSIHLSIDQLWVIEQSLDKSLIKWKNDALMHMPIPFETNNVKIKGKKNCTSFFKRK